MSSIDSKLSLLNFDKLGLIERIKLKPPNRSKRKALTLRLYSPTYTVVKDLAEQSNCSIQEVLSELVEIGLEQVNVKTK